MRARRIACSRRAPLAHQGGISLVELMIGLVLGLIIVSAAINMYAGSSRSSEFSRGLQTMQENGRYGVAMLRNALRLAGYSPSARIDPLDIAGADANSIIVRVEQAYDCNGQDTTAVGGIAVNRYSYTASNGTISCRGNSTSASDMPILEGVDGFRLLYGVDEDNDDDRLPDRFVPYDTALDPRRISSVRFALLINSGEPIRSNAVNETHVLLDTEVAKNDRMARHVFEGTVMLRNRD